MVKKFINFFFFKIIFFNKNLSFWSHINIFWEEKFFWKILCYNIFFKKLQFQIYKKLLLLPGEWKAKMDSGDHNQCEKYHPRNFIAMRVKYFNRILWSHMTQVWALVEIFLKIDCYKMKWWMVLIINQPCFVR